MELSVSEPDGRPRFVMVTALCAFLAVWQLSSGVLIGSYFISTPSQIALQLLQWVRSGYLWPHLVATLVTTIIGFFLASVSGVALGILLGSNDILSRIFKPFIYVGFSVPKVILAPLTIYWLGVGFPPSLAMSAITGFFFVFFNVYTGISGTDPSLLNMLRILDAGPVSTALKVRVPAAMPQIFAGLHQGLIYAFHGAIVGEMTASNHGMGYVIVYASTEMNSAAILAGLTVLGLSSYALVYGLQKVEKKVGALLGK